MALTLNKIQKTAAKAKNAKREKRRESVRPWQIAEERHEKLNTLQALHIPAPDLDPQFRFSSGSVEEILPLDIESASLSDLFEMVFNASLSERWQIMRQRSYWLSRLTYRQSWLSRLELYPRVRVPLPSFLTQRMN